MVYNIVDATRGKCSFSFLRNSNLVQQIDLRQYSTFLDNGRPSVNISVDFLCNNPNGKDQAFIRITFLNEGNGNLYKNIISKSY
jgi:hypothetical protein